MRIARNRVGLQLAADKLLESVVHGDQEISTVTSGDCLQIGRGHQVTFWRTRLPLPQPGLCAHPQRAVVLVQGRHSVSETAILPGTLDILTSYGAEPPGGARIRASPQCSLPILKQGENLQAGKPRIGRQFAVLPTREALCGANPKGSVARGEQSPNVLAGKFLMRWRLPGGASNAIEAKQAEFRTEPEIAVGCLRDCGDP